MRKTILYLLLAVMAVVAARAARNHRAQPPDVPQHFLSIANESITAAAEVQETGNIDVALSRHPVASSNLDPLREHLDARRRMYTLAAQAGIRYGGSTVTIQPRQFCENNVAARLVITAQVRQPIRTELSNAGAPTMTESVEEHVFRFVRHGEAWRVTEHHEINLAELHDAETMQRLHGGCDPEQVIVSRL